MKRKATLGTAVAVLGLGMAGCATAGHKAHHHRGPVYDRATVVDVRPIVRQVRVQQPQRECWHETHYQTVYHDYGSSDRVRTAGPTIAGGVIGGVVGRQFGSGSGRDAMTLLGTLVGASVANEHAHNRHRQPPAYGYREERPVTVERCSVNHVSHYEDRVEGYDVTYLYGGREYRTRTPTHPGSHIRVRVDVKPANRYR